MPGDTSNAKETEGWQELAQIELPSGKTLLIETKSEVIPAEEALVAESDRGERRTVRTTLMSIAATPTYTLLAILCLQRGLNEHESMGYKYGMIFGFPLFLWCVAICWFGGAVMITSDADAKRLTGLTRLFGIAGLVPMLFAASSIR